MYVLSYVGRNVRVVCPDVRGSMIDLTLCCLSGWSVWMSWLPFSSPGYRWLTTLTTSDYRVRYLFVLATYCMRRVYNIAPSSAALTYLWCYAHSLCIRATTWTNVVGRQRLLPRAGINAKIPIILNEPLGSACFFLLQKLLRVFIWASRPFRFLSAYIPCLARLRLDTCVQPAVGCVTYVFPSKALSLLRTAVICIWQTCCLCATRVFPLFFVWSLALG